MMAGFGAVAATLVALRPVGSGFWAHDVWWHLVRIAQWHRGVLDGVAYPRFLHDVYWGHGGPVMLFYSPLPYVISEIFCLAGAGPMRALELGIATAFIAGAAGVFLLARDVLGAAGAAVAAAAYSLAPYHLLNAWVRGAYAEMLAMAVLPFLLLAARRGADQPCARSAAWLAAATASVFLTHLISAIFYLPLAAAYGCLGLADAPRGSRRREIVSLAAGFACGIALAAFYWVPALLERAATHIIVKHDVSFLPVPHLISTSQLIETWWGFGNSGPGADSMSFQIGWVHLGAIAGGVFLAARASSPLRREMLFWLAAVAAALFLTTGLSRWIWETVPLLPALQYPWRLLAVAALGTSLCAGALVRLADARGDAWRTAVVAAVAGGVIVASFPFTAALPARTNDEMLTPAALASGMSTESMWMPLGASPERKPGPRLEAVTGEADVAILEDRTHRFEARVRSESGAALRARILHFPGWRAELDGADLPIRADATGAILVDVPGGDHLLRLTFGSTPLRTAAAWGSVLALAAVGWGLVRGGRQGR